MQKHKQQKEREEAEFQYSASDDEGPPEAEDRAGEPSSILQVGWLVGRLGGWVVGWLGGWLVGWLVG